MGKLYNLARVSSSTATAASVGSSVALGAAISGYVSFANAGVQNGETVSYAINEGSNSQVGEAVYVSAGPSLTISSITTSTNGGAAITLTGSAQVFISPRAQDFGSSNPFDNKFRNGSFSVWQRGVSLALAGSQYYCDGWFSSIAGGGSGSISRATNTRPGALTKYGLLATGGASVTGIAHRHRIESDVAAPLAGQTVTFQAWIWNNTGGSITPTITVKRPTAADNYAATSTDVNAVPLQACANGGYTRISHTFASDPATTLGLEVTIDLGNNFSSGAKSAMILEADIRAASVVEVPAFRGYGEELLHNQRYYYRWAPGAASCPINILQSFSTTQAWGKLLDLPTTMRVVPTVTPSAVGHFSVLSTTGTGQAVTAMDFSGSTPQTISTWNGFTAPAFATAAWHAVILSANNANAYIQATAEL